MNGELAQVIALAMHGTVWLSDPSRPAPAIEHTNSTFQYVRSVLFTDERPRGLRRRNTELTTAAAWFEHLHHRKVSRLWLVTPPLAVGEHTIDPHTLVAFAGAGTWLVLAEGPRRESQWWGAKWTVGDRGAASNRIWDVRYRGLGESALAKPPRPAVAESSDALGTVLVRIAEFASAHDLSHWTEWFTDALTLLHADDAQAPYHPDMAPNSYPDGAKRLLAAATRSWVFGGMGSWNDLAFGNPDDEATYRALSRALYDAVHVGFVAAVNTDV